MYLLPDLLDQLKNSGIELKANGNRLSYHPVSAITPEILKVLRDYKQQFLVYLIKQQEQPTFLYTNPPECRNTFTPHLEHKFWWECDPNTCYCYHEYGYPRLCQGIPCRWVWPTTIKNGGRDSSLILDYSARLLRCQGLLPSTWT